MSDILTVSQIKVPGTATSKDEAIREAGQILVDTGAVTPAYVDAMFEREKSVSTYMGNYPGHPARHQRGQGRDHRVRAVRGPLRPADRLGRQRDPFRGRHRRALRAAIWRSSARSRSSSPTPTRWTR